MSTVQYRNVDGPPTTLADQLYRAAQGLHAGEQVTSRAVDVMIEAAEILRSFTAMGTITVNDLADESLRTMEPAP